MPVNTAQFAQFFPSGMTSHSKLAQFHSECTAPFRAQYETNKSSWFISVLRSVTQCLGLGRIVLNENKIKKWYNIWILEYQDFLFGRFTGNSKGRITYYVNSAWNKPLSHKEKELTVAYSYTKSQQDAKFLKFI